MDVAALIQTNGFLWSPLAFASLIGVATAMIWLAFRPSPPVQMVQNRLDSYVGRPDVVEAIDLGKPFVQRAVVPLFWRLLRLLGRFAPKGNLETTERMLLQAGNPGGLTALDFFGLQLFLVLLMGGGYFFLLGHSLPFAMALRNSLMMSVAGYVGTRLWLRRRVRQRKHEVIRAFPDALDMMTISVEAGLAFESAMFKVNEKWDNALTREFRRAVTEMRVGTPRDVAFERMAERLGVQEVSTFVTVLIQSNQLGMSIAQVLHTQAEQMRIKRRQRAEELARQAGGKMVFPLVFCFIPALFVVALGPGAPDLVNFVIMLGSRRMAP
ncbi:MAG: type II secretion system F family protein [Ardenticatenaceae bacterium]|nr:type II secretion system F family protein [Ardenticatenaceae bacterium]